MAPAQPGDGALRGMVAAVVVQDGCHGVHPGLRCSARDADWQRKPNGSGSWLDGRDVTGSTRGEC